MGGSEPNSTNVPPCTLLADPIGDSEVSGIAVGVESIHDDPELERTGVCSKLSEDGEIGSVPESDEHAVATTRSSTNSAKNCFIQILITVH